MISSVLMPVYLRARWRVLRQPPDQPLSPLSAPVALDDPQRTVDFDDLDLAPACRPY